MFIILQIVFKIFECKKKLLNRMYIRYASLNYGENIICWNSILINE